MREFKHYEITKRFWDGTKKIEMNGKSEIIVFSFDEAGMKEAIDRAIFDLMARTLKRKDNVDGDRYKEIENALIPKLKAWFAIPESQITDTAFDQWHNEACNAVLKVLRKFYTNNDQTRSNVCYGKAQKIVNMTMKGLFCLKGADDYENHFTYCHIALDSFTLEWFIRYLAKKWFNPDKKQKYRIKISKEGGLLPKWSNLDFRPDSLTFTYEQYENDPECRLQGGKYHYMFLVKMIREYFRDNNEKNRYPGMTPLKAEFFIWPEIQLRMATEAFLFEVDPKTYKESDTAEVEREKLRDDSVPELILRVKDAIENYQPA